MNCLGPRKPEYFVLLDEPVTCMNCGREPRTEFFRSTRWAIRCRWCGLTSPCGEDRTEAVFNWNSLSETIVVSGFFTDVS